MSKEIEIRKRTTPKIPKIKLIILLIIIGILEVVILLTYSSFLDILWLFYLIGHSIWFCALVYFAKLYLKIKPDAKKLAFFTLSFTFYSLAYDLIGHIFSLYDTADFFFIPFKYDIITHFNGGFFILLILYMILDAFDLRYNVELVALILTLIACFVYELFEEVNDSLNIYFDRHDAHPNPFFWNSFQDIIMNTVGSLCSYIILKRYLIKKERIIFI